MSFKDKRMKPGKKKGTPGPHPETSREIDLRYKALAESFPQMVAETDLQGNLTFVNANSFKVFGYTKEDFEKGVNVLQMLAPDDHARARENIGRVLKGEKVEGARYTAVRKDGSTFPVTIYSSRTMSGDGPSGMTSIVIDETERLHMEEALRDSEALARTLLNMPADNVIALLDRDGNILDFNEAFRRRVSLRKGKELARKDVLGKYVYDFLPPETARRRKKKIEQVIRTRKPVRFEDHSDGAWYDSAVYPVLNEKNEVVKLAGFAHDITPLKKAEEEVRQHRDHLEQLVMERTSALLESEGRYRELVDNALVGVYQTTLSGEILYHNDYLVRMLGFDSLEEIKASKSPLRYKNPGDRAPHLKILSESGELTKYETEFLTRDGETLNVLISARLNGDIISGMVLDITDRKKAEEELGARTDQLNETNLALKVLLDQRDKDRQDMEERVASNVKHLVLPYLESLSGTSLTSRQNMFVSLMKVNLDRIVSPFLRNMHYQYSSFTPAELKVAGFIKDGRTVKDVANTLGISESAVNAHRQHIRNKLGLKDRKVNLRSYLQSLGDMPRQGR